MDLTFICLTPAIFFSSWGFGSLMANIARSRGRDTKKAFWSAAIAYALLLIVVSSITALINSVPQEYDIDLIALTLLTVLVLIGLLAPLGILVLRRRHPEAFAKSASSPSPVSTPRAAPEKQAPPTSFAPAPVHSARSGHIFVSYRRSDSADIAGRIYDRLIGKFGKDPIFKDVDSIPLGLDFKEYLDRKVGECAVLLAIIGDEWLDARDASGKRRLDDPGDFVRIEIQSALERGIPVIPLLVREAQMPAAESLPASLQKLVYRNGIPIRSDPDFHRDMDRLIAALEKYVS